MDPGRLSPGPELVAGATKGERVRGWVQRCLDGQGHGELHCGRDWGVMGTFAVAWVLMPSMHMKSMPLQLSMLKIRRLSIFEIR
jgi:hypothetical protein